MNRVIEKPPMKKPPGTVTVDGVLIEVISHDITPRMPHQPKM